MKRRCGGGSDADLKVPKPILFSVRSRCGLCRVATAREEEEEVASRESKALRTMRVSHRIFDIFLFFWNLVILSFLRFDILGPSATINGPTFIRATVTLQSV